MHLIAYEGCTSHLRLTEKDISGSIIFDDSSKSKFRLIHHTSSVIWWTGEHHESRVIHLSYFDFTTYDLSGFPKNYRWWWATHRNLRNILLSIRTILRQLRESGTPSEYPVDRIEVHHGAVRIWPKSADLSLWHSHVLIACAYYICCWSSQPNEWRGR